MKWNEKLIWDFYFAGPLFTKAERDFNLTVQKALESLGYKVYLPQLIFHQNVHTIFKTHLRNLVASAGMICVCDGSDVDSGTSWEIGHFYGRGRPIIGLRTDFRMSGDDGAAGVNLMISQSVDHYFNDADYMVQWIFKEFPIIGVREVSGNEYARAEEEDIDYTP
jgi:nucleoside 2-deoxyribosyltransferase